MSLIGTLIGYVLTVFLLLLLARMVLDWADILGKLPPLALRARSAVHAATEPVIAPVRRLLPPIRFGNSAIDLAFTVVFIAVLILRAIAFRL
ncbi:YggT family protein [Nocardia rhizosphaerae]|uniref:YggT family protein n=1 Tax=Nocardia rhizosphaerae TaxID=1691571 RepID=A0ABV8LBS8_9NOCA